MKSTAALVFAFVLSVLDPVQAADTIYGDYCYFKPGQVDLGKLLPPAPGPNSETQKADLTAVLDAQKTRTSKQIEQATTENNASIYHFSEVLGPAFSAGRFPKLDALFKCINSDSRIMMLINKELWDRPRPYVVSTLVDPAVERPKSAGSYPSGHAMFGYVTAAVLANMVPEKAAALYERGRQYGDDRVIAGVHFPSDVEAGRLAAIAIVTGLVQSPKFQSDFESAKAELRSALQP